MEDLAMVASVCSEITVILGALPLLTLAALEAAMLEMIMGGAV